MNKLTDVANQYTNTSKCNHDVYLYCESILAQNTYLSEHRQFIENNKYGFGLPAFHGMWALLVDSLPTNFSFLEIGVFKGQVLSLISLLAKNTNKVASIYGITPLDAVGELHYPKSDYMADIEYLFHHFDLSSEYEHHVNIHKGLSTDSDAVVFGLKNQPYDIVYIDGSHSNEDVKSDITNYSKLVKPNGYLVMDDAGTHLQLNPSEYPSRFIGIIEVADAVKDLLDNNDSFKNILNVCHNRVFQRIK